MATLLPPGKQQFIDGNGIPIEGGFVYFYIPNTTTPKDTYQNAAATILNTNPVRLDAGGYAIIYGQGIYRQIVTDSGGNQIWDQLTSDTDVGGLAWGEVSTGTPNAQVVAAWSFSQRAGQQVSFIAGFTNTGPLTVTPGSGAAIPVLLDSEAGPVAMSGGEVVAGNAITMIYEQALGAFHLVQNNRYLSPFVGAVVASASQTISPGWLECNGASLLRTDYLPLFVAIGTTYGAVDGTHFTLPDLRGQFIRGWSNGSSVDSGRVFGSNQTGANLAHIHTATFAGSAMSPHAHTSPWGTLDVDTDQIPAGGSVQGGTFSTSSVSAGTPAGSVTVNSSGSESRPVNVAMMYQIKY